jgi:hypothetical protein
MQLMQGLWSLFNHFLLIPQAMPDLARQYTEMWIISEVFHLQTPPRPSMHWGVGRGCCSYVPEAVVAADGAKTRYFLCFPILSHEQKNGPLGCIYKDVLFRPQK